jgi:hypothetical protein
MKKRSVVLLAGAILMVLFFIAGCNTAKSRSKEDLPWIHFDWADGVIGDRSFEKAGMLVTVTIDNIPQKFIMQFDVGADVTMFHAGIIAPFVERYPDLKKKLITQDNQTPQFYPVSLKQGTVVLDNLTAYNMGSSGDAPATSDIEPDEAIRMGTIGASVAWGKVLIIDYPNQRFAITEQMPEEYRSLPAADCVVKTPGVPWGGRHLFPFTINGRKELVLFDTGSSIFSLLTSKENAMSIAGSDIIDTMTVTRWDQYVTMNGHEIVRDVSFGDKNLKGQTVYYEVSDSTGSDFSDGDVWGITGNRLFLENTVILDYPNKTVRIK